MRITLATPLRGIGVLAEALGASPCAVGEPSAVIGGICTDTSELQAGDLFLAMRGKRHNGNDFIGTALARGAVAVLTAEDVLPPVGNYWLLRVNSVEGALLAAARWHRERCGARVIAISGSAGKTTVKEIAAAVLGEGGTVQKSEGNFNSTLGMPLSLLSMERADRFVLEVGISHAGEMEPLARALLPQLAVLTNVGSAHLGNFAGQQELLAEKLKLAAGQSASDVLLLADSIPRRVCCAVPSQIVLAGASADADCRAVRVRQSSAGVTADIVYDTRTIQALSWPLPGGIGLSCLALGAAIGMLEGLSDTAIRAGLERAAAMTPRMRRFAVGERLIIDDTYNASPEAVIGALEVLYYLGEAGARAAVLGDIGELGASAAALHTAVGECAAHSGLTHLFTYGSHAMGIAAGALRAGMPRERVHTFSFGEEQALAAAVKRLMPRGTVLFKASRKTALERVITELGRE